MGLILSLHDVFYKHEAMMVCPRKVENVMVRLRWIVIDGIRVMVKLVCQCGRWDSLGVECNITYRLGIGNQAFHMWELIISMHGVF